MGVGAFGAGIFHLYTHAFFKALLFLGSGAVIHALHGEQDIRNMGGLKSALPVTYWTFLIGSLAIAGVPGLAGFFSKDEILFETFAEGHRLLWVIGALTSLLTATYMFRLVFLTFHGARRHDAPPVVPEPIEPLIPSSHGGHGAHGAVASAGHDHGAHGDTPHGDASHGHGGGDGHGNGGHLHDAPPAMALALIVLAIGSVAAGYVGVPHALGGENRLGAWLAPSFAAPGALSAEGAGAVQVAAAEGAGEGAVAEEGNLEASLMSVSSAIALAGIAIAAFIWLRRREIAQSMAQRLPGLHRLLLNKYFVDEVYDATIVQPVRIISEEGLWRGFDVRIVDGAVNGVASIVDGGAWLLRRLQTGSVRAYASSVFLGAVLILGYYLWRP
jgi:NADH-quinone oxidoreductase subunit L